MILDTFNDSIKITPSAYSSDGQGGFVANPQPSGNTQTVPGRIEPIKHSSGARRMIADQGDIAIGTHALTCAAVTYNPDGTVAANTAIAVDSHVTGTIDTGDYIVVAPAKLIRDRFLNPSHYEVEIQQIGGAV